MLFLAGAPNRGPGAVSPTPHEVDWGDGGGSGEGDPDLHDYFFRGEVRRSFKRIFCDALWSC